MTSFYSVVRYVPSALAEEFVNVGVIVLSGNQVHARFLSDWNRVRMFTGAAGPGDALDTLKRGIEQGKLGPEQIREFAQKWAGCVQLSEPRPTLEAPESALEYLVARYLRLDA